MTSDENTTALSDMHTSHEAITKRLKRARGHLGKVVSMIENGESCVDVAHQLQAVSNAIYNAKQALIKDHVAHCLGNDVVRSRSADSINAELEKLIKYL